MKTVIDTTKQTLAEWGSWAHVIRDAETNQVMALCPIHNSPSKISPYSYAPVINDALNAPDIRPTHRIQDLKKELQDEKARADDNAEKLTIQRQRIQDLLEANNRYQQEARDAKATADDLDEALKITKEERDMWFRKYCELKRQTQLGPVTREAIERNPRR